MPSRHSKTGSESAGAGPIKKTPCGDPNRSPLDIAGQVNDLINCYLVFLGEALKIYVPLAIIALILLVVMFIAAKEFLK